ncbi:hypothetical protein BMS3Abin07_00099 [bacterium BMS3Abin07]|nr:hypothetical protein BMS3Abin07_00099 [bacterium BMS3Abin07]
MKALSDLTFDSKDFRLKIFKVFRLNILAICTFVLFLLFTSGVAVAATYYVATNGNDGKAGTSSYPWATFAHAMSVLQPGDTLYIKDGTYYQSLAVTVSGTTGNPITIKALNDGGVTIDGQNVRIPCKITGVDAANYISYINLEGMICKNSSTNAVHINYTDHINIKRVSAYSTESTATDVLFSITHSDYIFLEDCVAFGPGKKMFTMYETTYVTARRLWGMWQSYTSTGDVFNLYGASHTIMENCIATRSNTATGYSKGIMITNNPWNGDYYASYNLLYGNIVYNITGNGWGMADYSAQPITVDNTFDNNVIIGDISGDKPYGFLQKGDKSLTLNHMTIVNAANNAFLSAEDAAYTKNPGFGIGTTLKNSSIFSILSTGTGFHVNNDIHFLYFTNTYNNLYGMASNYGGLASAGTGEIYVNPSYDIATYGNGAYLMVPSALKGKGESGSDIGAEILYRYVDGVLTSTHLWPWPMEARICKETGYSVTYENGYSGCAKGGGLWKTLNGVYPDGVYTGDTIAPAPPFAK